MTAVHVRRRRRVLAIALTAVVCLAALTALVGVSNGSSAEPPTIGVRPRAPAAAPPPDPLAPRAIRATSRLLTVPADRDAPADRAAMPFAVEVEEGVEVDRRAFATEVERTLQDARGWSSASGPELRRTGEAEAVAFRITLASPATTDRLCRPLRTRGTYSCRRAARAVLNAERWARGARAYGSDLAGYRRYMINHEVGHALGLGHEPCPSSGEPAPVMMQQTKGVGACRPNPWPLETEGAGPAGDGVLE